MALGLSLQSAGYVRPVLLSVGARRRSTCVAPTAHSVRQMTCRCSSSHVATGLAAVAATSVVFNPAMALADDGGSTLYIIGPELTFATFCLLAVLWQGKQRQAKNAARASASMDEGVESDRDE